MQLGGGDVLPKSSRGAPLSALFHERMATESPVLSSALPLSSSSIRLASPPSMTSQDPRLAKEMVEGRDFLSRVRAGAWGGVKSATSSTSSSVRGGVGADLVGDLEGLSGTLDAAMSKMALAFGVSVWPTVISRGVSRLCIVCCVTHGRGGVVPFRRSASQRAEMRDKVS